MKNNCLHDVIFIKISKLMMHFSGNLWLSARKCTLFFRTECGAHSFNLRLILPLFFALANVLLNLSRRKMVKTAAVEKRHKSEKNIK